ncbi:MAG: YihY/virulence factor BrkB family protein [Armatimonadetes bacterium]|nr:YihY/virulence factor BrkB family protein [Armatimonadota bacterium]
MGARGRIRHVWQFVRQSCKEYTRDSCSLMAAAISFYVLLSLVPLLLVGLATFGLFLGDEKAFQVVSQFLEQFLPPRLGGDTLYRHLADLRRLAGMAGILGLVSWVWAASASFSTITRALDIVWEVPERRGFIASRLLAVAMMLIVGVLGLLSFVATSAIKIVQEYQIPWLGTRSGELPVVWQIVGWVLPLSLSITIFVLCYLVLPNARVGWRPALLGGLVGGILWELTKQGFALYVANFADYNRSSIYGYLGGLVFLVMWVYYSAAILLFGAEVASVSAEWSARGPKRMPEEDG